MPFLALPLPFCQRLTPSLAAPQWESSKRDFITDGAVSHNPLLNTPANRPFHPLVYKRGVLHGQVSHNIRHQRGSCPHTGGCSKSRDRPGILHFEGASRALSALLSLYRPSPLSSPALCPPLRPCYPLPLYPSSTLLCLCPPPVCAPIYSALLRAPMISVRSRLLDPHLRHRKRRHQSLAERQWKRKERHQSLAQHQQRQLVLSTTG